MASDPADSPPLEVEVLGFLLNDAESTDLLLRALHGEGGAIEAAAPDLRRHELEELLHGMASRGLVRGWLESCSGTEQWEGLIAKPAYWWELTDAGREVAERSEDELG